MKLGYSTGYWDAGRPGHVAAALAEEEGLGFDSVWTAEAYGSDALTPLAWWGAHHPTPARHGHRADVGAHAYGHRDGILDLDHLTDGRFVLGLGASGPQVVEGWYGQRYSKPLARTREYVDILRQAFAREVVTYDGVHYRLPRTGRHRPGQAAAADAAPSAR